MPLIMPIYGTRPEAIKMAPVIQALQQSEFFECVITVTGQHRAMLDQVNELFEITPEYDLDIIQQRQSLTSIMARTLNGLDELFLKVKPDAVIVQGDTTTSTAAAISAFYHGIRVIHVEAGLRSGDLFSPFPEEANRKLTSQIASLHLAPTSASKKNLVNENVPTEKIRVTGNTVIDALLTTVKIQVPFTDYRLEDLAQSGKRVLLVTSHRRENQGQPMKSIGRALARIANDHDDVTIVLPIHKNPVVREAILPELAGRKNIVITEPLGYGEFTRLLSLSHLVITDSGGIQEEAPSLGIPVLVMRETTERPEAVDAGAVVLVGTNEDKIYDEVEKLLNSEALWNDMAKRLNPYGDGKAAHRTLDAIGVLFGQNSTWDDFAV